MGVALHCLKNSVTVLLSGRTGEARLEKRRSKKLEAHQKNAAQQRHSAQQMHTVILK